MRRRYVVVETGTTRIVTMVPKAAEALKPGDPYERISHHRLNIRRSRVKRALSATTGTAS